MTELSAIVRAARELRRSGEPFLLATVVRVCGSAYRRPGARMVVTARGPVAGSISGGCLEHDVVRKGFWRTRSTPAVVVRYDASWDEELGGGFGLGCDGTVDVLIERSADAEGRVCDPIELLAGCLEGECPVGMATVFRSEHAGVAVGQRLGLDAAARTLSAIAPGAVRDGLARATAQALRAQRTTTWSSGDGCIEALVESILPPPHLFVFGTGLDAVPVVTIAKTAGWSVSVCDRQAHLATQERFAAADRRFVLAPPSIAAEVDRCALPLAVVLSHNVEHDRAVLGALLESRARYVGVLGPRHRTARILADLARERDQARGAVDIARLHAPVGLDIGAETPAEVALAIVAEAQAVLAGAPAGRLRDRRGPIHVAADAYPAAAE